MRFTGLPYTKRTGSPAKAPKGQVHMGQQQQRHVPESYNDAIPSSMPHSRQENQDAEVTLRTHSCHTLYMGEMWLLTAHSSSSTYRWELSR